MRATTIAARHGIAAGAVRAVPGGVANQAYLLGDDLFLRIATPGYAEDLHKEAAVIPVARAAGVKTPAVLAYEDGRADGASYMIVERLPGKDLAELDGFEAGAALRELGRQLAMLHRVGGPLDGVSEDDGGGDPRPDVERAVREGHLDAVTAHWLIGWSDRLSARIPAGQAKVLLHGDVAPQNLLVVPETGELSGVVDWGDACLAEPAMEFAKLRLDEVALALEGYYELSADRGLEPRILWYHLSWGLTGLVRGRPRPGERHWTAPPGSRLLGLLRFFAAGPPEPWSDLT